MLEDYILNYHVIILPNILVYSCLTPAKDFIKLTEDLELPGDCKALPIECFFNLYNKDGELMAAAHEQTSYLSLKAVINSSPIKMLKEFLQTIKNS